VGDELRLHNRNEGIICQIVFLHRYNSFREMVDKEGVYNLLPQLKNRRDLEGEALMSAAIRTYEGFPGSDRVRTQGCVAIGVKYLREG
jgi:ASC-1-like (ASCH) protein